jgi:hypothetical protein
MRSGPRIKRVDGTSRIGVSDETNLVPANPELVNQAGNDALNTAIRLRRYRKFGIDRN